MLNHLLRHTVIKSCEKPCEYMASRSTRSLHIIYVYRFQKKGNTTIYSETRVNRLSCQDMVFILTLSTAISSQVLVIQGFWKHRMSTWPHSIHFTHNSVATLSVSTRGWFTCPLERFGIERHAQVQRPLQAANQPTPHRESSQSACVSPREA